jgi:hypothetical protein
MGKYDKYWKPVASVIKHTNMDYDDAVTLGSQFGQLMAILEKKDKEIENLKLKLESYKKISGY